MLPAALQSYSTAEFKILREGRKVSSRTKVDFKKVNFNKLRYLVERNCLEASLRRKGVQEGWPYFKEAILRAQEQAIPMQRVGSAMRN